MHHGTEQGRAGAADAGRRTRREGQEEAAQRQPAAQRDAGGRRRAPPPARAWAGQPDPTGHRRPVEGHPRGRALGWGASAPHPTN